MQKKMIALCFVFFLLQLVILTDSSEAQTDCYIDLGIGAYDCYTAYNQCISGGGTAATCAGSLGLCAAAVGNAFGDCLDSLQPQPNPFEFARCNNTCQNEFDECIAAGCPFNECFDLKIMCQMACEEAFGNGF